MRARFVWTRTSSLCLCAAVALGCGGASAAAPAETSPECTVALRLEQAPTPPGSPTPDTPWTAVSLVLLCDDRAPQVAQLRTEMGACFESAAPGDAMLAATCWWAGSGGEWSVTRVGAAEGGELVAHRRESDEGEAGPSAPVEVARMPIPEHARLRGLR